MHINNNYIPTPLHPLTPPPPSLPRSLPQDGINGTNILPDLELDHNMAIAMLTERIQDGLLGSLHIRLAIACPVVVAETLVKVIGIAAKLEMSMIILESDSQVAINSFLDVIRLRII